MECPHPGARPLLRRLDFPLLVEDVIPRGARRHLKRQTGNDCLLLGCQGLAPLRVYATA